MQEENRFFRFVWRLDAILLALGAILLIGTVVTFTIEDWVRQSRYQPTPGGNFTPVHKGAEQNYTYRLEPLPDVTSFPHEQILSLRRWSGSPASWGLAMVMKAPSASFYHYTDAVNLLAVNIETGESHWLFEGYRRAVVDQQSIYAGRPQPVEPTLDSEKAPPEPIALVMRTIDKDTNNDGQLDYKDGWSLYFYRPGDDRATKFFEADYILSMQEVEGGDFFVVYEQGKSAIAATFSVPNFKLKSQRRLPDVPR